MSGEKTCASRVPSPIFNNHLPKNEDKSQAQVSYLRLFRFSRKSDKILFVVGFLASVATGLSSSVANYLYSWILETMVCYVKTQNPQVSINESCFNQTGNSKCENISSQEALHIITLLSIYTAVVGVSDMIFTYIRVASFDHAANGQFQSISSLYLKSILRQEIAWFDEKRAGQFAVTSMEGLQKYKAGIGRTLGKITSVVTSCIFSFALSLVYGWKLTLVSACLLCISFFTTTMLSLNNASRARTEMASETETGNLIEEAQSAWKTIIAFGGQDAEAERFNEQMNIYNRTQRKQSLLTAIATASNRLFLTGSWTVASYYAFKLASYEFCQPNPTYDTFALALIIFNVFYNAFELMHSAPLILAVNEARKSIAFVHNIIDRKPTIDSLSKEGKHYGKLEGEIEFHDVFFNYPSRSDTAVLGGISFKISAGETVAIVGESGSGKSTLIQMIQRFYDPLKGTVTIDGVNLSSFNIGSLRKNIGVVGQEPVLLSTTIYENIRYGEEAATREEVERAAKDALAHDFINQLPNKYETVIGGKDSQLSGGQKQRIAIARALIGNPQILLLDEATSALDYTMESKVFKSLRQAAIGRTIVIVTHRLLIARHANNIYVMSNGKVTEKGNHENLVRAKGIYSQIFKLQEKIAPDADDLSDIKSDTLKEVSLRKDSARKVNLSKVANDIGGIKWAQRRSETNCNVLFRILREVSPGTKVVYFLVVVCSALMGSTGAISIMLSGSQYNLLTTTNLDFFNNNYWKVSVYLGILACICAIAAFSEVLLFTKFESRLRQLLRLKSFKCMLCQETAWYDQQIQNLGDIFTHVLYDVSSIIKLMTILAFHLTEFTASLTGCLIVCMVQSWKLGFVFLASLPLFIFASMLQNIAASKIFQLETATYKTTNKVAIEAISNIRTVASLHREKSVLKAFDNEMQLLKRNSIPATNVQAVLEGLTNGLVLLVLAAFMYYGGLLVIQESLAFGKVFMASRMVFAVARHFTFFININSTMNKGFSSAKRLYQTMERKSALNPHDPTGITPAADTSEPLRLKNVQFCYPSRREVAVLKGISLTPQKGQAIGLVGPSGCGKSTIFQLFMRMYDPDNGTVDFAGEDVRLLNLKSLRSQMAIVSQEPSVFDRSILENIAYGDHSRNIPMDEIISAARSANIHDFISTLPDGYNTRVGDKGLFLSGGQKQRIAIARALVRNPKVLFLDEATSALDNENEKVVQRALEDARVGRTCIIAAHRLSNITKCDVILVIKDGRIVEKGNHQELWTLNGEYRKMHSDSKLHNL